MDIYQDLKLIKDTLFSVLGPVDIFLPWYRAFDGLRGCDVGYFGHDGGFSAASVPHEEEGNVAAYSTDILVYLENREGNL